MSSIQTPQNEQITDEQKAKWAQVHDDLLRKHGGNRKRFQRILANPEYVKAVIEAMNSCGLGNEFANERVEPNAKFGYDISALPSANSQIAEQRIGMELESHVEVIQYTVQEHSHPEADGLGAIPSITDLGRIWEIPDPLGDGYGQVVERMLGFIKQQRGDGFHNYRYGQLTKDRIRLFWSVKEAWHKLEESIPAEDGKIRFFVIPMNFGAKYQGFSPRNARMDSLDIGAMSLDPVSVAALLLGWPERQQRYEDSVIDCSGAEYYWDGGWSYVCDFYFDGGRLRFDARESDYPRGSCGSVVAFPGVSQFAD